MLVNKALGECLAAMSKIKNNPQLAEKFIQQVQKNAKSLESQGDSFSKGLASFTSFQDKKVMVKFKNAFESAPDSFVGKIDAVMEKAGTDILGKIKDPTSVIGDISVIHQPRTELKRVLRNDPESQSYLKKFLETLKDGDVKKSADKLQEMSDYKKLFNVKSFEEYVNNTFADIPELKDAVLKTKTIAEKPMLEQLQEFVSYLIKK